MVWLSVLLFIAGLYIIIRGGELLVDSAIKFQKRSRINPVIIGATVISIATTLPEVFVSIFAVVSDNHGIAIGNAVGSMIANIALVLALYMTFLPHRVARRKIIDKVIYLFIATALVFVFAFNLSMTWFEGLILLTVFVLFLIYNLRTSEEERCHPDRPKGVEGSSEANNSIDIRSAGSLRYGRDDKDRFVFGFLAGQIMLIIGAFLLVDHGVHLAGAMGVSQAVVGLTIIAVGTSLPELVTCITAIRKKSGGLALGTIIGANIISATLLIGSAALVGDWYGEHLAVTRETVMVSLPVLFALYLVAIVPMMLKARTYRWQGIALIMIYALYVGYLFVM